MNNSHSTALSAESAPTTSVAEPTDTLSAAEPMHSPDATGMVEGHNFYVQDGSGYSQELIDFANANGQTLTPDQSMELHQHLVDKFGPDYIKARLHAVSPRQAKCLPRVPCLYGENHRLRIPLSNACYQLGQRHVEGSGMPSF